MKILVVRVGRVGDLVMITPALDALLARYPDAQLTLLTSLEGRRVLAGFDTRLTDIWIHRRRALLQILERRAVRRRIRDAGFDRINVFESRPSYAALVRDAAPAIDVLSEPAAGEPVMHFAERCARLVDADAPVRPVRLPVRDDARVRARAVLAEAGIDDATTLVGLHPGHSTLKKRSVDPRSRTWPAERWGDLGRRLAGPGTRVIMDLAPDERALGEEIVAASGGAVTLLTPPLDFERYKATLERLDLLVATNSGPMHVGAAVGTPVVALFHGWDPADCGPFTDASRRQVLRAEDSPGGDRLGLAALETERVAEACQELLRRG